jgi:ABC-type uncharacterized transport system substrate-binding protein
MNNKVILSAVIGFLVFFSANDIPAQSLKGKKVLFIDSYHQGYAWSDGITNGVQSVLKGTGVTTKIVRMDTKRNTSEAFKKKAALDAKKEIERFKPNIVIAADDNASKYLIKPFYKDSSLPFVFCGVNWNASVYGFPFKNTTGMIEVTPVPQLLEQLAVVAKGNKLGVLAPNLLTAKKEVANYREAFKLNPKVYFAKNYKDYKKGFLKLQKEVDMLLLLSDGGLYDKRIEDLNTFILNNTQIPTGSSYDFMAPRAMVTFAKIAEEQGEWSAKTAIRILSGASPSTVPITKNEQGKLIVNIKIAEKANIELPFDLVQSAQKLIE